jgi:hypothetical protein
VRSGAQRDLPIRSDMRWISPNLSGNLRPSHAPCKQRRQARVFSRRNRPRRPNIVLVRRSVPVTPMTGYRRAKFGVDRETPAPSGRDPANATSLRGNALPVRCPSTGAPLSVRENVCAAEPVAHSRCPHAQALSPPSPQRRRDATRQFGQCYCGGIKFCDAFERKRAPGLSLARAFWRC